MHGLGKREDTRKLYIMSSYQTAYQFQRIRLHVPNL